MPKPLRNVQVFNCQSCHGKGRIRNRTCYDCQGRRVVVIQSGKVIKLTSNPNPDQETIKTQSQKAQQRSQKAAKRRNRLADVRCTTCSHPSPTGTLCEQCHANQRQTARRFRLARLPEE